jgi:stage V sporulation protein SpoVS
MADRVLSVKEIRVTTSNSSHSLAKTIIKLLNEGNVVDLVAIGTGAVNSATKAFIHAKGEMATYGKAISFDPSFFIVEIENEQKEAIKIRVEFL